MTDREVLNPMSPMSVDLSRYRDELESERARLIDSGVDLSNPEATLFIGLMMQRGIEGYRDLVAPFAVAELDDARSETSGLEVLESQEV